jgi:hypothetical protein
MLSLPDYFPFSVGESLTVTASWLGISGRHGTGRVARLSGNVVEIDIHFPAQGFIHRSPDTNVKIICEYRGSERGNRMCLDTGENTIEDDNVTIQAFPADQRLRIDPSVEGEGHTDIALSVKRIGQSTVKLTDVSGVPDLDGVTITLTA